MKTHVATRAGGNSAPVVPRFGVMSVTSPRWMEVALIGGRCLKFNIPADVTDEAFAKRIEEVLKMPAVSITADDKLFVIPTASIQTITVSPAPMMLPTAIIRGATLV